jgi:hypothetical protein
MVVLAVCFYRVALPLRELEKHGHQVTFRSAGDQGDRREKPITLRDMQGFDIVFGQRFNLHSGLETWRRARTATSRLVYDTDDDVWNITPENWQAYHLYNRLDIQDACEHSAQVSDLITVTTPYLGNVMTERTGNPNVAVLPNCIPAWVTTTERGHRARPAIGWQGGASHGIDVGLIAAPVRRFLRRFPAWDLRLVGTDFRPTFKAGDQATYAPWVPIYENTPGYFANIDFDIGLAPLAPKAFNSSKSNIKVLEYAARGIPSIATDCDVYRSFIRHGENGFLVKQDFEWGKYMQELASDNELRAKMGEQARQDAMKCTIEENYVLWESAYSSLFKSRSVGVG